MLRLLPNQQTRLHASYVDAVGKEPSLGSAPAWTLRGHPAVAKLEPVPDSSSCDLVTTGNTGRGGVVATAIVNGAVISTQFDFEVVEDFSLLLNIGAEPAELREEFRTPPAVPTEGSIMTPSSSETPSTGGSPPTGAVGDSSSPVSGESPAPSPPTSSSPASPIPSVPDETAVLLESTAPSGA